MDEELVELWKLMIRVIEKEHHREELVFEKLNYKKKLATTLQFLSSKLEEEDKASNSKLQDLKEVSHYTK